MQAGRKSFTSSRLFKLCWRTRNRILQTDGAVFMEYAVTTALNDYQCTTMYEHEGYLPSLSSDLDLDYNLLKIN